MTGHDVERAVSSVTDLLLIPVLVLALLALVVSLAEAGRVSVEVTRRRHRSLARLEGAAAAVRAALAAGNEDDRRRALRAVSGSGRMAMTAEALGAPTPAGGNLDAGARQSKLLADYDYASVRHLERTRLLVRAGPALGLMGTLIPLSPALQALSRGDVVRLAQDLRVAFSVTVVGLLVGAISFAVSLVRDRLYGQDLSDLEYLAACLAPELP